MHANHCKARSVFQKVRQLREEVRAYVLSSDHPVLPVEVFQHLLSQMYQLKIEKLEIEFESDSFFGNCARYIDHAVIFIKKNQPEDMKRFVAVKELCHLMIDQEEDWSRDGVRTLEAVVQLNDFEAVGFVSEQFAEIAAIELLYPFADRACDLTKIRDGQLTEIEIMDFYKLPQFIVKLAISDDYHSFAKQIWETC